MSTSIDNNRIIKDISILYELSLSIGQNLDLDENVRSFIHALMAKKDIDYASVWLKENYVGHNEESIYNCKYANPRIEGGIEQFNNDVFFRTILKDKEFNVFVWEDSQDVKLLGYQENPGGVFLIFDLNEIGFLIIHHPGNELNYYLTEARKLKKVINKFSSIIEATSYHELLKTESEERKKNEHFTKRIIESSLDGVIIINEEGKVTHWNKQTEGIFNYSEDEAVGKLLHNLIMPDQFITAHHEGIRKYLLTGEHNILNQRIEIVGKRKNGEEFPVELTISPIRTEGKVFFSAFVRDLTEQKLLMNKLEDAVDSLERNKKYLEALNLFAGKILNHETIEEILWEVTNVVIRELQFVDCVIYLFDEKKENLIQKAAFGPKKGNTQTVQDAIVIPVGEGIVGSVALSGMPELVMDTTVDPRYIMDDELRLSELTVPIVANGEVIGVIDSEHPDRGFFTIDHLKKLQTVSGLVSARMKNILNQEQIRIFNTAIEQYPVSVVITDTDGYIEYVNPQFTEVTQYSFDDVIGRKTNILKSGMHDVEFYKNMWETITHKMEWKGEICNKKKNGDFYWESVSISPILNNDGSIAHYFSIKENITETKEMNEQLKVARKEAEEASMAKSRFLANMSHEIRTPIMGIQGAVELLSASPLDEDQKVNIKRLKTSTKGLITTINDILDFSKIESGLIELEWIPFSVYDVANSIFESMDVAAEKKGLRLILNFDSKLDSNYEGDPTRLRQILMNLTSNAIKFTEAGFVEISVQKAASQNGNDLIDFSVKDTGIGIDEGSLSTIFESFKQEDESTSRNYGGTGLGLAISKQLAGLMGGDLKVQSAKGFGSKFYFTLSLKRSSVILENTNIGQGINLEGVKILLVEDNKLIQDTNKALLKQWKVEVYTADNGKEAVDFLENNTIDIVLLDKNMPIMDGFETARHIRQVMKSEVPIIALTADVVKGVVDQCMEAGMNDYVSKPFELNDLKVKISKLLPGNSSVQEESSTFIKTESNLKSESVMSDEVDLSMLYDMTHNNEEQVIVLIKSFVNSTKEYQIDLQEAVDKKNCEQVQSVCHSLKSSFLYLGLRDLSDLARDLEGMCTNPDNSSQEANLMIEKANLLLKRIPLVIKKLEREF